MDPSALGAPDSCGISKPGNLGGSGGLFYPSLCSKDNTSLLPGSTVCSQQPLGMLKHPTHFLVPRAVEHTR